MQQARTSNLMRQWRQDAGLLQEDVAAAARRRGLKWTRATVAAIELGKRAISLDEFLSLRGAAVAQSEFSTLFAESTEADAGADASLDSEIKAAQRLKVTSKVMLETSQRLWGMTLTQKRDQLLKENEKVDADARDYWTERGSPTVDKRTRRQIQATRGHITRALLTELEKALPRRKGHR